MVKPSKIHYEKRQSLQVKSVPTKRAPDAGDSGAISSIFLRLSIFPVGRRSAARPSAGNANRWLASQSAKTKPSLNRKFCFWDWLRNSNSFFSGGVFKFRFFVQQIFFYQQSFRFILSSR
jgi:hypothetical protein